MNSSIKNLDVIVVYSDSIAKSALDEQYKEHAPFPKEHAYDNYNDSYQYFLASCKNKGLKTALTTSRDIIGPGLFFGFWTFNEQEKQWVRNGGKIFSEVLFDKMTPDSFEQKEKMQIASSSEHIYTFNKKILKNLFQNKLNTYTTFHEFAIPSIEIEIPTKENLLHAKKVLDRILSKHPNKQDFGNEYIMKDKTGAGGNKIHKINFEHCDFEQILQQYREDKKEKELLAYILQPFINCDKGFVFENYQGFIDLRVIFINGKPIQSYIRIAKKGSYKCNEHQGGNLVYLPISSIPKDILSMSNDIMKILKKQVSLEHTLFALDYIRSNNGNIYFIEGNSNPGIDWDHDKKVNERESKKLIDLIIEEIIDIIKDKADNDKR